MTESEYLVSLGRSGAVRRFRAAQPAEYRRGDRVVVSSAQGLDLGEVLCPATTRHAALLPEPLVGELLRHVNQDDTLRGEQIELRSQRIYDDCQQVIDELALPLNVLDVELAFDGRQAILHYLCWAACDERPLVSTLSRQHDVVIQLHNLALQRPADAADHNAGCGEPNCGKADDSAGCTSCSTGHGCTNCGAVTPSELQEYFAGLRQHMEASPRTPLL